jgi:hypothetical protein
VLGRDLPTTVFNDRQSRATEFQKYCILFSYSTVRYMAKARLCLSLQLRWRHWEYRHMACSDLSNIQEQLLQAVAEQLISSTWRFAGWSEKHCPDWSEHGRALGTYWLVQTYNSTARSQLSNSTYLYSPNLFPLISSFLRIKSEINCFCIRTQK